MTASQSRLSADSVTLLIGVVTIVSGFATGLFSDLRPLGQGVGLVAFVAWVVAIGLILWGPWARRISGVAFVQVACR